MGASQQEDKITKLPLSFYLYEDVVFLSQALLGMRLLTFINGELTGGIIIETEAYKGPEDRACHAYQNRRTKRTEVMFHNGGICYVYLCYGMHSLMNVVTNVAGIPHAILIRAIQPEVGIENMLERRKKKFLDKTLTNGPGSVTQALGIDRSHNGLSLLGDLIWIERTHVKINREDIRITPRIGVEYAGVDAKLPWRFLLQREVTC